MKQPLWLICSVICVRNYTTSLHCWFQTVSSFLVHTTPWTEVYAFHMWKWGTYETNYTIYESFSVTFPLISMIAMERACHSFYIQWAIVALRLTAAVPYSKVDLCPLHTGTCKLLGRLIYFKLNCVIKICNKSISVDDAYSHMLALIFCS